MSKMAPVYNLIEQEDEAERLQAIFNATLQNLVEAKEYLWLLFSTETSCYSAQLQIGVDSLF